MGSVMTSNFFVAQNMAKVFSLDYTYPIETRDTSVGIERSESHGKGSTITILVVDLNEKQTVVSA